MAARRRAPRRPVRAADTGSTVQRLECEMCPVFLKPLNDPLLLIAAEALRVGAHIRERKREG